MKNLVLSMIALAGLTAACGSSFPTPTDRLASSEAAIRSAKELGAQNDPQAALHVKLADEQVATAKNLMHDGENRRADLVLQRADSDAELAIMITREKQAKQAADQSRQNLNAQTSGSVGTTNLTSAPMQQVNPIPSPSPSPSTPTPTPAPNNNGK